MTLQYGAKTKLNSTLPISNVLYISLCGWKSTQRGMGDHDQAVRADLAHHDHAMGGERCV